MFPRDAFRCVGDQVDELFSALESADLDSDTAAEALDMASHLHNRVGVLVAVLAGRLCGSRSWQHEGDRSPSHQIARRTGRTVKGATQLLLDAEHLSRLEEIHSAAVAGELSPQQLSLVADAADCDPAAQGELIAMAKRASIKELVDECARVKARVIDIAERTRRIHANRSLREYTDSNGVWHLNVVNTPAAGAQFMASLAPFKDAFFNEARKIKKYEPIDVHWADGLAEMAMIARATLNPFQPEKIHPPHDELNASTMPSSNRPHTNTKIIVRVDLDALLRGFSAPGETCDLVGFGPVPVSTVTSMIDCGNPFLAAVATKGQRVMGVAHLGRRANASQRTALEWLQPTCSVLGCASKSYLEIDHRVDWARTHFTLLEFLDRLCSFHHDLKTSKGWALVAGRGKRRFVAPIDPRHPSRAGPVREHGLRQEQGLEREQGLRQEQEQQEREQERLAESERPDRSTRTEAA